MKILCDVHLPQKLVACLNQLGIEAIHGSTILNGWHTKDKDFCKYSDDNDYIFATKDNDFRNTHFIKNTPRKLIKINLGNISNVQLIKAFEKYILSFEDIFKNRSAYVELNKDSINVLIH